MKEEDDDCIRFSTSGCVANRFTTKEVNINQCLTLRYQLYKNGPFVTEPFKTIKRVEQRIDELKKQGYSPLRIK